MEHEKISRTPLLNAGKTLTEEGWARTPLWTYSRKEARGSGLKEWDSYLIIDPERSFIMLSESGSSGMKLWNRITYADIDRGKCEMVMSSKISLASHSTLPEDAASDSEITFADSSMTMAAVKRGRKRQLLMTAPYMELPDGNCGIKAHIELSGNSDEAISAAFSLKEDSSRWGLRTIESPMDAEGIMFAGHNPIMLSGSAAGAFCYTRSKLPRPVTSAIILCRGWSIAAGEERYINSITYEGKIDKLGSMLFTRMTDKWIVSEEGSRVEIEAIPVAAASDAGITKEFIRCSGSFRRENGDVVTFADAYGIISYQGM